MAFDKAQLEKELDAEQARLLKSVDEIKTDPKYNKIPDAVFDKIKQGLIDSFNDYKTNSVLAHYKENATGGAVNIGSSRYDENANSEEVNKALATAKDAREKALLDAAKTGYGTTFGSDTAALEANAKEAVDAVKSGGTSEIVKKSENLFDWGKGNFKDPNTGELNWGAVIGGGGVLAYGVYKFSKAEDLGDYLRAALIVVGGLIVAPLALGSLFNVAKEHDLIPGTKPTNTPTTPPAAQEAEVELTRTGDVITGTAKINGVTKDVVGVVDHSRGDKVTLKELYEQSVTVRADNNSNDKLKSDILTDVDAASITAANTPITDKATRVALGSVK